jgi:hypothetical protein
MNGLLKRRKQIVRFAIGAVLLANLVLLGISWRLATAPGPDAGRLSLLQRQHDLLAADVARGHRIRAELPAVEQQCDVFFKERLPLADSGYSQVVDNLGAVARTAGLRTETISFRQQNPDARGVIAVEIGATVNGDYPSVVRFINGLERSPNFYVLDGLSLAAGSTGELKLNLRLRTYFRT